MRGLCPLRRSAGKFVGSQVNTVNWVYPAGNDIRTGVAVGTDGTVYFGSDDTYVYALLPNGGLRWRTKTNGAVRSSPLLTATGALVVGSDDDYLYSLDAATGALRWKTNLSEDVSSSPAVAPDGTIYVASDSNRLYALNPSGAILWSYLTGGDIDSSPALMPDGTIIVGSDDDFLYALKPALGLTDPQRLRWKTNLGSDINAIPAIGPGDHFIYARTQGGKLKKVDPADGHVVTTFNGPTDLDTDSSPAIGLDGNIYVGLGHNIYGLRPDLTQKWIRTTLNDIKSSPSIGADGTVYVGADDERVYALKPADGSVLWSVEASGLLSAFRGTAAIGKSGAIYIGNDDNKLYSIGSFACDASHKCANGTGPCTVDTGCATGLSCGFGVAERYGLPSDFGVCWDPGHCATLSPPECGGPRTLCGDCCVPDCGAVGSQDGCGHTCVACVPGKDTDRDGLLDCAERGDATRWTNPLLFNGVSAQQGPTCHAAPTCALVSSAATASCFAPDEEHELRSGWDFSTSSTNVCNAGFNFDPPWTMCRQDFAVEYETALELQTGGRHCFELEGATENQCASLILMGVAGSATTITGAGPTCLDLPAGVYGLQWFYETTSDTFNSLHVDHCFGGAADCNPSAPLTAAELRPTSSAVPSACWKDACSELCPCSEGDVCDPTKPNGFCKPELECRTGVGGRFGRPASTPVCWMPECDDQRSALFQCGTTGAPCGPVCPPGNAPNCTGKHCGSDGAGGRCGDTCAAGEANCESDADCGTGLVCLRHAGARYGLSPELNVCAPKDCRSLTATRNPCLNGSNQGHPTACGVCPSLSPDCAGRVCGPDGSGGTCGPTPAGTVCINGIRVPQVANVVPSPTTQRPTPTIESPGVGTMPGQFAVTSSGDATYRLALRLPPGRGGLTPDLGLSYGGNRGNGLIGTGWALDGMQAITRCNKTIAQDGKTDAVHFDDRDAFCLNGERLVRIRRAFDGRWFTEYALERNDFSGIIAYDAPDNVPYRGPDSFQVTTPSGRVLTFGGDSDSRILTPVLAGPNGTQQQVVQTWALSRITDRSGNYAEYHYDQTRRGGTDPAVLADPFAGLADGLLRREYYPRSIQYSFHPSDPQPQVTVFFNYDETRGDPVSTWRGGMNVQINRRLTSISVLGDRQHRRYQLSYDQSADGVAAQSRLSSVLECVSTSFFFDPPVSCLPATTFDYQRDGGLRSAANAGDASKLSVQTVLDFDGDGRDDLLMLDRNAPSNVADVLLLSRTTASASSTGFQTVVLHNGPHDGEPVPVAGFAGTPPPPPHDLSVLDWDNDGRDDLLDLETQTVYRSTVTPNGYSFNRIALASELAGTGQTFVLDLDGDGRKDLLRCVGGGQWQFRLRQTDPSFGSWRSFAAKQAGVTVKECPALSKPGGAMGVRRFAQPTDIDGDGAQELLFAVDKRVNTGADLSQPTVDGAAIEGTVAQAFSQPRHGRTWFVLKVQRSDGENIDTGLVYDTRVPWEAASIDMNGDGLPDFYQLTECNYEKMKANGIGDFEICQYPGRVRVLSWHNTGGLLDGRGGFIPNTEYELPAQLALPWTVTANDFVFRNPPALRPEDIINGQTTGNFGPNQLPQYRTLALTTMSLGSAAAQNHEYALSSVAGAASLARVLDYDGDGRADILFPAANRWAVLRSTGDGFEFRELPERLDWQSLLNGFQPYSTVPSQQLPQWGLESPVVADFNGDGLPDFMKRSWPAQAVTGTPAGSHWDLLIHKRPAVPQLTHVTNGLREGIDVDYGLLTDASSGIYVPQSGFACDYPERCAPLRRSVVKAHHLGRRNATGALVDVELNSEHFFQDGRVDLWGRGFVGFAKYTQRVRPTHNASGFEHTVSSEFDNRTRDTTTNLYFKSFVPTRVTDTRKEGDFTHTVTTTSTYDVQLPATYPRTLHRFERLRHEVTTEQRGTGTEQPIRDWITSVLSIDKYGNPQVIEEGIAAGAETVSDSASEGLRIKSLGYVYTSNPAFDVPGLRHLPASEIDGFVLNPPGAPWATTVLNQRQTAFTYYGNGTLHSLEVEPGATGDAASQNRKVVLDRDGFGNVVKRTQSRLPASEPARVEQYIYPTSGAARGHFPIEVINEKDQHSALQFNRNYGTIARVIDPNGLMQDYHYDDFGRMAVSVDTDLTTTTVQYRAGSATAPLQVHVRVEGGTDETSDYDVHGRSVHDSEKGAFDRDFVSDTVFDDLGRVASQTRPHQSGHIIEEATRTTFSYDALGRELRSEWFNPKPGGGTEVLGNDSCYTGLVSCTRNPRGFTRCARRDRIGRITATWDPPSVQNPELKTPEDLPSCATVLAGIGQRTPSTTYGYGEVLEKVTDPAGNTTRIVPDAYGRTLALSDPSTGVTRSRWNGFGELERAEDAEGRVVEYQHDSLGRLALRRDATRTCSAAASMARRAGSSTARAQATPPSTVATWPARQACP